MSQYFGKYSRYTEGTIEKDCGKSKKSDSELLDEIQEHEQATLTVILLFVLLDA